MGDRPVRRPQHRDEHRVVRFALIGVAPLDNQIGLEHLPPGKQLLEQIVIADIALMDRLDAGIFHRETARDRLESAFRHHG